MNWANAAFVLAVTALGLGVGDFLLIMTLVKVLRERAMRDGE